jgi:glycosyltransferase involved in cell wall biosynthesis
MEAGLPLIATDFKLWKEIIEENNCGICINPNNVEDIKNAITFFIKNPEKIKEYGINGRRMIEKFYNWDESAKKLLDIYKELEIV